MRAPRLTQFSTQAEALATARVPPPTVAPGRDGMEPPGNGPWRTPYTPRAGRRPVVDEENTPVRRGFIHPTGTRRLAGASGGSRTPDATAGRPAAGCARPALSHCEVLMFLDHAPGQQMRMTELAAGVLISRSACTRLVDRLDRLGYVTRRAATDDRRGLYAQLTDTGRDVIRPARATHQEGVRAAFLDRARATDQVALGGIWARVRAGRF